MRCFINQTLAMLKLMNTKQDLSWMEYLSSFEIKAWVNMRLYKHNGRANNGMQDQKLWGKSPDFDTQTKWHFNT